MERNDVVGSDSTVRKGACLEVGDATETSPARRGRSRPTIYWNDIRNRAFQKWRAAGEPGGDCTRFWLEAERELLESR